MKTRRSRVYGAAAALLASAAIGVGVAGARYAILGRQRTVRVLERPARTIVRLPRMNATESPITFGLLDERRRLHVIGPVVGVESGTIDRVVEADCALVAGQRVQLVGNVFGPDSELARSAVSVRAQVGDVLHQLWDFEASPANAGVRFVHVHGLGAAPETTLRSVHAVRRLGYSSTVVSLDGSPDITARVSGIRATAVSRVRHALDHARSIGASQVVLVGWSFGAQLALEAAARRADVAGAVLISPTVDLLTTIRTEARARGIPGAVANAACVVLTTPVLSRLARVDRPVAHHSVAPSVVRRLPILHLRSDRDETLTATPEAGKTVVKFPTAPHTMEWNTDPDRFIQVVSEWIRRL